MHVYQYIVDAIYMYLHVAALPWYNICIVLRNDQCWYFITVWLVYWCFTSHAGGLKKLYLRSGSQRHRLFAGFFNVPVLHWHGTNLFIRWFRHTAPLVAFYDTLGIRGRILDLNPRRPHWGYFITVLTIFIRYQTEMHANRYIVDAIFMHLL